jgi:hypothetical protein
MKGLKDLLLTLFFRKHLFFNTLSGMVLCKVWGFLMSFFGLAATAPKKNCVTPDTYFLPTDYSKCNALFYV